MTFDRRSLYNFVIFARQMAGFVDCLPISEDEVVPSLYYDKLSGIILRYLEIIPSLRWVQLTL